jgi:hypothetical protein
MKKLTVITTNLDVYFLNHFLNLLSKNVLVELLNYLKTNQFKEFIVSDGGVDFMREALSSIYEIPKDQIIGGSLKYTFIDEINNTNKDINI